MSREDWGERLAPERLKRLGLGLAVGAAGGAVAHALAVPLAWMLGALFATMAARLAGAPVDVPMWVRANFLVLIGLFLGESFEGVAAAELLRWPFTIAAAMLYVPVAAVCAYAFYRRVAGEAPMTAACSSIPGGLIAVTVMSGSLGADERQVALAQSFRIAIVVCMAPVIAFGLLGYPAPSDAAYGKHALIGLPDLGVLLAGALATMWAMRKARIPIPFMVGPLVASAVLRMAGVVEGVLPHWLVEVALVVTGSAIGSRFHGIAPGRLMRFGLVSLGATAILMGVSALFAVAVSALTGQDFLPALLAYAPGGVAEMSLIALAIDADPGFVAIHHMARIVFVLLSVPLMSVWIARARARAGD
ncbi:MAG TPA: AbrB family transcriptional regulator [Thermohalobaculum sp.]|nr:AbrB family transcriptional regulator [Thermohalobaculum sp.]